MQILVSLMSKVCLAIFALTAIVVYPQLLVPRIVAADSSHFFDGHGMLSK